MTPFPRYTEIAVFPMVETDDGSTLWDRIAHGDDAPVVYDVEVLDYHEDGRVEILFERANIADYEAAMDLASVLTIAWPHATINEENFA